MKKQKTCQAYNMYIVDDNHWEAKNTHLWFAPFFGAYSSITALYWLHYMTLSRIYCRQQWCHRASAGSTFPNIMNIHHEACVLLQRARCSSSRNARCSERQSWRIHIRRWLWYGKSLRGGQTNASTCCLHFSDLIHHRTDCIVIDFRVICSSWRCQ